MTTGVPDNDFYGITGLLTKWGFTIDTAHPQGQSIWIHSEIPGLTARTYHAMDDENANPNHIGEGGVILGEGLHPIPSVFTTRTDLEAWLKVQLPNQDPNK